MIHQAIYNTHSNVKSITDNEDGSVLSYDQDGDVVTLDGSELVENTRLQGIYDSQEYARNRKAKYDLLNQDELRFDDLENTTTTWQDAINAIKLEYPK